MATGSPEGESAAAGAEREVDVAPTPALDGARKRAAVETYARNEATLRRTARRYSLCADDAEDALQRGLEILLRKAPSDDPRELIRWMQTVVKHEALAVRRERERILAGPASRRPEPGSEDWVALIPSEADGPLERAERREAIARSREALQTLKPQELRALTLLAEGYSYREIGELTGFSATKINRCLAEGRERFRRFLSRSEDGRRCTELAPLISAFCDGEANGEEAAALREHLRACAHCRATLRTYRAAPAAAAAIAPTLPLSRSLLDRAHEAVAGLAARLGGGDGTDSALSQVAAAGGTRGAGMAALAKVLAVCVGTAGGAAACVATGVIPAPLLTPPAHHQSARTEVRAAPTPAAKPSLDAGVDYEPQLPPPEENDPHKQPSPTADQAEPATSSAPAETTAGAVEYTPPPSPVAAPSGVPAPSGSESASSAAAGEFGP